MTAYYVGSGALEHRCQCCGEFAEDVFCDDCLAHMEGQEQTPPGHVGQRTAPAPSEDES